MRFQVNSLPLDKPGPLSLASVSSSFISNMMVFRDVIFRISALRGRDRREAAFSPCSPASKDLLSAANKEAGPHHTPDLPAP